MNTGTEETARNSLFYFKEGTKDVPALKLDRLKNEIVEEGV